MSRPMTIDIVSDVTCPWCVIGLRGLEQALERIDDAIDVTIQFHPYELNPDMPAEGRNMVEHLSERMGIPPAQVSASREMIKAKAAEVDFVISLSDESRICNTFDAHRLLHWAGLEGRQQPLKRALFEAYFTLGQNLAEPDVLVAAAEKAGLDGAAARAVLAAGRYADAVRRTEQFWLQQGIQGVPAFIIDGRYLVSGAQPPEAFEQALRQIAAQPA